MWLAEKPVYCVLHIPCVHYQLIQVMYGTLQLAVCCLDYACFPQSSFTGTTSLAGTVRDPTCWSSSCYFLPTLQPRSALSSRGPFCNGMSTHRTPTMASTSSEPTPVTVQQSQPQLKSLFQCALQHSACSNSSPCSSAVLTTVLESCDNWTVPVKGVLGGGHGSER